MRMPTVTIKTNSAEAAVCGRYSHPVAPYLLFASHASICRGRKRKDAATICCTGRSSTQHLRHAQGLAPTGQCLPLYITIMFHRPVGAPSSIRPPCAAHS